MAKNQKYHLSNRERSVGDRIFDTCNAILLILLCLVTLYPMYFVLCASFTENTYLVAHPGAVFCRLGSRSARMSWRSPIPCW